MRWVRRTSMHMQARLKEDDNNWTTKPRGFFVLTVLLCSVLAAALASCSRKKTVGRDEVRSQIRSANSFVAESEMFIDYIRHGHATHRYVEAHAAYLQDAVRQSEKELAQEKSETRTGHLIRECITDMDLLRRELSGIPALSGNNDGLAAAKKRMESIRKSLQKADSSI
jgi:hypothetical protein